MGVALTAWRDWPRRGRPYDDPPHRRTGAAPGPPAPHRRRPRVPPSHPHHGASMSINQNALDAVTSRATTDRDFRERLLADPTSAIGEILGRPLPPEVKLQVVEA